MSKLPVDTVAGHNESVDIFTALNLLEASSKDKAAFWSAIHNLLNSHKEIVVSLGQWNGLQEDLRQAHKKVNQLIEELSIEKQKHPSNFRR